MKGDVIMAHYFSNGLFSGEDWSYSNGIINYKKKNYCASNIEDFKVNSVNWKWVLLAMNVKNKN